MKRTGTLFAAWTVACFSCGALVPAVGACSSHPAAVDGGLDAGSVDAGPFVVGPHQPYPTIPWNGGPTLTSPNLVTITYASDPNAAAREAFGDWVFGSQWYAAWTGQYGVGPGTHLAKVQWTASVPTSLDEQSIGTLILDAIADGGLPTAVDGGVLYELYLPVGPTLTFRCRQVCEPLGKDFVGGFHWDAQRSGQKVAFAVVPTCSASGNTESQGQVEFSSSHELAEGITDPFPSSNPAYVIEDPASSWGALDGEVGDLCNGQGIIENGHTLQRIWSNASASDGGAPCIPTLPGPSYGTTATPSTVSLMAGQFADVTLQAWSAGPRATWNLTAAVSPPPPCTAGVDSGVPPFTPTLLITGVANVNNGNSRALRVGVPANAPSGSSALVVIISSSTATDFSLWPVLVEVQ